jgi:heat shock protein HtpX
MVCPACDSELIPRLTRQGVEVDYCEKCKGFWLDRGEIFHFTKNPKKLAAMISEGLKHPRPTDRKDPRTSTPLMEISILSEKTVIEVSEKTGGIWLDEGELEKMVQSAPGLLAIDIDQSVEDPAKTGGIAPRQEAKPALTSLPSLAFRSSMTIFFLYSLLTLVLITFAELTGMAPGAALLIGFVVLVIHFILGPWLMDFFLNWFFKIKWKNLDEFPEHLGQFVTSVCREKRMKVPRFGYIDDGAPNAFTYGHTPNNARIVVTRGILELLDPEEVEAVVAHEIGHAKNWDMLLMTVVQLVPLVLYYVFRRIIRSDFSNGKIAYAKAAAAVGAYLVYLISEYIVLWFSRTREYFADRFAGQVTRKPNSLAQALVKIAYGLAGQEKEKQEQSQRSHNLEAIGSMGIFDNRTSRSFAINSASIQGADQTVAIDPSKVVGAMKWDLWNPWAKFYELNSTHPLVANRLNHLGQLAETIGQAPYVRFKESKPESYWDEFFFDILIMFMPSVVLLSFALASLIFGDPRLVFLGLSVMGALSLVKLYFTYPLKFFPDMSVSSLLKKIKVSAVRPVPCKLRGKVIGRGVPGLIWSEDFVLKDDTGIIFLDYRQPLRFWEFFHGLLRSPVLMEKEVEIEGWFRRAPVPYIELRKLTHEGVVTKCYIYLFKLFFSIIMIVFGIGMMATF